jgi:DNA-binding transcriptional regulator YhcF (GntR family)/DNA-binding LacI/PurR family transcriptional regulator
METLLSEMECVDARHPDPLFQQVASRIIKLIRDQHLQEGDRIPSPRLLAGELGVNELTVRRGMKVLVRQGMLYSRQGKGIFVTDKGERPQILFINGMCEAVCRGNPYYSVMLEEITRGLAAQEMGVESLWRDANSLSRLTEHDGINCFAGFIFVGTGYSEILSQVQRRQLPYVILSSTYRQHWTVYSDYPEAYRLGLQELSKDSCGEITAFILTEALNTLEVRGNELRKALPANSEVKLKIEGIEQGSPLEAEGYRRTLALAAAGKLSNRIFVTNDLIARGVSRALLGLGWHKGQDKPSLAVIAARQQIIPLGLPVTYLCKDAVTEAQQTTQIICAAINHDANVPDMATIHFRVVHDSGDGSADVPNM